MRAAEPAPARTVTVDAPLLSLWQPILGSDLSLSNFRASSDNRGRRMSLSCQMTARGIVRWGLYEN